VSATFDHRCGGFCGEVELPGGGWLATHAQLFPISDDTFAIAAERTGPCSAMTRYREFEAAVLAEIFTERVVLELAGQTITRVDPYQLHGPDSPDPTSLALVEWAERDYTRTTEGTNQ
jgi:hypothetical protein